LLDRIRSQAKIEPLDFQLKAIEYFITGPKNVANFSDMGTGKTMITLHAIRYIKDTTSIDKIIIVCPKSIKRVWIKENYKHLKTPFNFQVLSSTKDSFDPDVDGYILNYNLLGGRLDKKTKKKSSENLINKLKSIMNNSILILDECQKIGRVKTHQTKAILKLFEPSARTFLLTGTPIQNRPENAWSILYILNKHEVGGTNNIFSYYKFINTYCIKRFNFIVGYRNLDKLADKFKKYSIRFTKDILNLPLVFYNNVYTELTGRQLKLYKDMKNELLAYVKTVDNNIITKEAVNILSQITRLLQICSNPILIGDYSNQTPAKILILDELLEEHIGQNREKVIVSTIFRDTNKYIVDRYQKYNPKSLMGGMSEKQISRAIEEFQEGNVELLVIHPEVGGIGQTLTASNIIIFYDRGFSLAQYLQAIGRINRISQTRNCHIINLVCENTIEEHVDTIIHWKEVMSKTIVSETERKTFQEILQKILLDDERSNNMDLQELKFKFGDDETDNNIKKISLNIDETLTKLNEEILENISSEDLGGIEGGLIDMGVTSKDETEETEETELFKVLLGEPEEELPIKKPKPAKMTTNNQKTKTGYQTEELPKKSSNCLIMNSPPVTELQESRSSVTTNNFISSFINKIQEGFGGIRPKMIGIFFEVDSDYSYPSINNTNIVPNTINQINELKEQDIKTGTELKAENKKNKSIKKFPPNKYKELAITLDKVLKKNGYQPPWNITNKEILNIIDMYMEQKNIRIENDELNLILNELSKL